MNGDASILTSSDIAKASSVRSDNERIFLEGASEGETVISLGRSVFCGLTAIWMSTTTLKMSSRETNARLFVNVPILAILCVASLITYRAARHHRLRREHIVLWSVIDAITAFIMLLVADVIAPYSGHPGFAEASGISGLCLIIVVNALRLMPRLALMVGGLHLGLATVLVVLDVVVNGHSVVYAIQGMIFLLCSALVAYGGAKGALCLAERASAEATRAARARGYVDQILQEHHDMRTLLSSTRLNAEMLVRGSNPERAQDVIRSVRELADFVDNVKTRSLCELAHLETAQSVEVSAALSQVVDVARHRFSDRQFCIRLGGRAHAAIAGGSEAFTRCLLNLLANACEGDGDRRANFVSVRCRRLGSHVWLQVRDDGPGFPDAIMRGFTAITTKRDGTGLGLLFARSVVEASGGKMILSNPAGGGATVTCRFSCVVPGAPS